jgi:hypothetical protein
MTVLKAGLGNNSELPYDKSFHLNRFYLASSQGRLGLSVPILGGRGVKVKIDEVKISYEEDWNKNHLFTIRSLYSKAPYFEFFYPEICELYSQSGEFLLDWNKKCFAWICSKADWQIPTSHQIHEILSSDFRYHQLFQERTGFLSQISVLDLLLNEGKKGLLDFKKSSL